MIKKIYKEIKAVALISTLLSIVSLLIDGLVVGHYLGNRCFAAFGLASPLLVAFTTVTDAISSGEKNCVGEALGRGDQKKANERFISTLAMTLLAALVCSIIIFVFAPQIAHILSSDGDGKLVSDIVAYLRGYIGGVPGIGFFMICLPIIQLDGDTSCARNTILIYTFSDIVLDFISAFLFKNNIFYIGLSSTLSIYIADIYMLSHFRKSKSMFSFRLSDIKLSEVGKIIKSGTPEALGRVSWMFMTLVMNRLAMNCGGVDAVSALSIALLIYNLMLINLTANSKAVAMLTATYAAEFDCEALKTIFRLGMHYSFWGNLLIGIIAFILARPVATLYAAGSISVILYAVAGIRFKSLGILNCTANIFREFFLGMKHLGIAQMIYFTSSFLTPVLIALIFSRFWGMNGIWFAFVMGDVLVTLALYFVFSVRKGHLIPKISDYIVLSEADTLEDSIHFDIHSANDVVDASEEVAKQCKAHGRDMKIRLHIALAIEELGMNIIHHGFHGEMEEKDFLSVRVLFLHDTTIVSIKDNANAFDPTKYIAHFAGGVSHKNLGLTMVMKIAKRVRYTYAYGLNCIFVDI